jgi:integrase
MNTLKQQRIIYLPEFKYIDLEVTLQPTKETSQKVNVENNNVYYITDNNFNSGEGDQFYHFPVILNKDGFMWYEANNFLLKTSLNDQFNYSPQKIARIASRLLDYKIWSEDNHVDIYNFSALRAKNRPTYRYFKYLMEQDLSAGNINQRTSLIYKFTLENHSRYNIDINRIDQVTDAFIKFKNKFGQSFSKKIKTRKLTKRITKRSQPNTQILDDGESLRPLSNDEQKELIMALNNPRYSVDERLIFQLGLDTGARKQTILTLRLKHVKGFTQDKLSSDGYFKINVGFGTDIDTKFDKRITLHISESLAEKLKVYAFSQSAVKRRLKFLKSSGDLFNNEDDTYLFLGERGNCRYMAKSDPRFDQTKNPPSGTSIQTIINRLYKYDLSNNFPLDYKFHWNRASYAFNYYQYLQPLVDNKKMSYRDQIYCIQNALGHSNPETTENYIRYFIGNHKLLEMQSKWEDRFFTLSTFDRLLKEVA